MKYAPAGSPVVVNLRFDEERAYVAVEDRGPGIEPEDLPHIFERFYRGKTAAGSDGLGLGLYICELIAEAHGGSIAVENRPGRGSIFTLALPAR